MMRLLAAIILLWASSAWGVVTINSSTTFPYNATTAGETYQLAEDVSCSTTCIVLNSAANNAVIDLNGYTMTFGTANSVTVANADFENWTGSTPDNWTVETGAVASTPAIDWGNYDLTSPGTFRVRSDAFSLNGGQTYMAWAFVKSSSSASGVLRILNASDNSVVASLTMTGARHFNRGFAVDGAENAALQYKPSGNVSVKLEFEATAAYTYRVAEINMAPKSHHGIVARTSSYYFPDISGTGNPTGVTVRNGTITQGAGGSAYSSAIIGGDMTVSGLTINVSGPDSGGIIGLKSISNSVVNSSVTRVFNRMYGTKSAGLHQDKGWNRAIVVDGVTVNNFPQYGAVIYNCPTTYDNGGSVEIKNSTFRNKGVVTEPYAMAFSGAKNLSIHDNVVNPGGNTGRGILVDAVGCVDPQIEGATGNIYNNQFLNIYEDANFEYDISGLEAVGIRIRNWGGQYEGHKLNIYENVFNYTNNATGSHANYGININASSPYDQLDVHHNTIKVNAHDTSTQWAAGIALQGVGDILATRHKVRYNTISSNSYALGFDGNDGTDSTNLSIYNNILNGGQAGIRYGMGTTSSGTTGDNDIYCNQITTTALDGYPLYFNGTLTDILVDYNQLTTAHTSGFKAWADSNETADILLFGNGTVTVTGGGSIGTAVSATNGSAGCYSTAGSGYTPPATITCYKDSDGDLYGDGTSETVESCSSGYYVLGHFIATTGDCSDTNALRYPGAPEACGGSVDLNCDGSLPAACPPDPDPEDPPTSGILVDRTTGVVLLDTSGSALRQ